MKTLTEMKRKNPALIFARRYHSSSIPQKLNFSTLTATKTAGSFKKITRKKYSTITTTSLSSSDGATTNIESCSLSLTPQTTTSVVAALRMIKKNTRLSAIPCEVSRMSALQKHATGAKTTQTKKKMTTTAMKSSKHHVKTKQVSFQDRDEILGIIGSRQDMSLEERNQIWYSREEYDQILQACSKQINMLDRGKPLKDRKFCARGLESHTRVQAGTKSMNRCLAYQAVLCEQDLQIRAGVVVLDDEKIAQLYNATSYSNQLWAHAVGLADQREAQDIHDESEEEFFYQEGGGWGPPAAEQSSRKLSAEYDDLQEEEVRRRIPEELVARAA